MLGVVLGLTVVAVLCFGKPQRSYFISMFQQRVYPNREPEIPSDFNGTWNRWWFAGGTMESVAVRDGLRQGRCVQWHGNGRKQSEGKYEKGEKKGKWLYWDQEGRRCREEHYVRGKRSGIIREWYGSGQLMSVCDWQNGSNHGQYSFWFANGVKAIEGQFVRGRWAGKWTIYDKGGAVIAVGVYRDGRPWEGVFRNLDSREPTRFGGPRFYRNAIELSEQEYRSSGGAS